MPGSVNSDVMSEMTLRLRERRAKLDNDATLTTTASASRTISGLQSVSTGALSRLCDLRPSRQSISCSYYETLFTAFINLSD